MDGVSVFVIFLLQLSIILGTMPSKMSADLFLCYSTVDVCVEGGAPVQPSFVL